ncbi:hypothetical protein FQA47_022776 [Oryzias melastigma]|uniref:Uncharacterized protein n=1 Tax=Oryzias melastigma TaxID=30732 RepID=A0A834KZQ8_ORYME|nr:hypothetical protein FQA47_022776 [Oryzias melastigma]
MPTWWKMTHYDVRTTKTVKESTKCVERRLPPRLLRTAYDRSLKSPVSSSAADQAAGRSPNLSHYLQSSSSCPHMTTGRLNDLTPFSRFTDSAGRSSFEET